MVDRADRWHAGKSITGKASEILQEAIDITWLQVFGPFKRLIIDREKESIAPQPKSFSHGTESTCKLKQKVSMRE